MVGEVVYPPWYTQGMVGEAVYPPWYTQGMVGRLYTPMVHPEVYLGTYPAYTPP